MEQYLVIIIGSGFGGQCAAIHLKRMGIQDFLILERRPFMGGTWCQNTYPGAAVDVPSPLYSIANEPYAWSQLFADQAELERYTHHIIDRHGLRLKTRLNSNVTNVVWEDRMCSWIVSTETGVDYQCQFLINAIGPLSTPKVPILKGQNVFRGETFHTNAWNHGFDYKNKRVAVIGSGASAAQIIPELAKEVKLLHVFQRTPHWVVPRNDKRFSRFQRRLLRNRAVYRIFRTYLYWKSECLFVGFKYSRWVLAYLAQRRAQRHLATQVKDSDLRSRLTPDFTIGCKRIILSDTFYSALCQDNVALHDKDDSIKDITEFGVRTTQGKDLMVDAIIYATGYSATDGLISYPVIGREGKILQDFWAEYPRAYLGTVVPQFPNFFIVMGPNTGIGHTSAIFMIESQMQYIMRAIQRVIKSGKRTIEVRSKAEEKYTGWVHREMEKTVWKHGGCRSWYQGKGRRVIAIFPGFTFTYRLWTRLFRKGHHKIV